MAADVKTARNMPDTSEHGPQNRAVASAKGHASSSRSTGSANSDQRSRSKVSKHSEGAVLQLIFSLSKLMESEAGSEGILKIIPECVRAIDSRTPKPTVNLLLNALESCAQSLKPQIKVLCSNSIFNLGIRLKPAAVYLECWEKSLLWDIEIGTDGLVLKCARYLVALIDMPETSCAGIDAAFTYLAGTLSAKHWGDPLPDSGSWPKVKVAMNKLSESQNLRKILEKFNLEFLAIFLRAILPYRPSEVQVRSVVTVAIERLEAQNDNDIKAQWHIINAQLLGARSKELHHLVQSDDVSMVQRLEVLETLVATKEKVLNIDSLAKTLLSKLPHYDQPSMDLCNLLCLDIGDKPIYDDEARHLSSLSQQLTIEKLESLCESKNPVTSSRCALAVADNLIQQGEIALATSILQREAVILRGRISFSPQTGRITAGACLPRLGLLYLFLETNVRLFFLFIRSGDSTSAQLFLKEAKVLAQQFHLATMTAEISAIAETRYNVDGFEGLRAHAPRSILLQAERDLKLNKEAVGILTRLKQLERDKVTGFLSDAVSIITAEPTNKPASSRVKLLKNLKLTLESIWKLNADIPAYSFSSTLGQRYATLTAELTLLGAGADILLMLKMLDQGKLNAVRAWQKVHNTRLVARMPLKEILSTPIPHCPELNLARLPQDKTVVCIDFIRDDELLLTRIEANKITISLRLPLSRMTSIVGVMVPDINDFLTKLRYCIKNVRDHAVAPVSFESETPYAEPSSELDGNAFPSSNGSQISQGAIDSKRWWRRQLELDKELARHLEIVESLWLGGFRAIFDTELRHNDEMARLVLSKLQHLLKQYIKPSRTQKQAVDWQAYLIDPILISMMSSLDVQLSGSVSLRAAALEDIVTSIVDQWYVQGLPLIYEDVHMDELVEAVSQIIKRFTGPEISGPGTRAAQQGLVLVLDAKSLSVPWESLSCVPAGTTRATSLAHLVELEDARRNGQINGEANVLYLLNPDGELPRTQREFEPEFKLRNWQGWAGREAESNEQLVKQLEQSDCYIYLGHNAGDSYVRPSLVRRLKQAPSALLLGCSSAWVSPADDDKLYDVSGPICDWWAAKSPLVVGLLWDVPDKDLNRFTKGFLARYFDEKLSAGMAVSLARSQCLLPHTTGAAPVVYGLI